MNLVVYAIILLNPEMEANEQVPKSVSDGKTLKNCNLHDLMPKEYRVAGGIRIENRTSFTLSDPQIRADQGYIQITPREVAPFESEAVTVHNIKGTATGSYGTLSYFIEEKNCRIVLMWSLPYNHDIFSNWLAVDITEGKEILHNRELFDKMYSEQDIVRRDYDKTSSDITYKDKGVKVFASMGTSHRTQINFTVVNDSKINV